MQLTETQRSFCFSAWVHVMVALAFLLWGEQRPKTLPIEERPMIIDLVPVADIRNLAPATEKAPEPEPPAPEPEPEPVVEEPLPTPPVEDSPTPPPPPKPQPPAPTPPEPAVPPPPARPQEKPLPPAPKKPDPPQKKPQPKKQEEKPSLESVLKNLEARDPAPKPKVNRLEDVLNKVKPTAPARSNAQQYNPAVPLSMTELDLIRRQIQRCWNIPAGVRNARDLQVPLRIRIASDGTVQDVEIVEQNRYLSDGVYRAAVDSAGRAVWQCSPLQGLPAHKYESWKHMELVFDPREMLY